MSKAIMFTPDGGGVEVESKSKHKTLTNGHEMLVNQTPDDLKFVSGGNWWHIETANTDYGAVHDAHGKALARDFVRYLRASEDKAALFRVLECMRNQSMDYLQEAVAEGFINELSAILLNVKKVNLYQ